MRAAEVGFEIELRLAGGDLRLTAPLDFLRRELGRLGGGEVLAMAQSYQAVPTFECRLA
jgi:hypothetical protein